MKKTFFILLIINSLLAFSQNPNSQFSKKIADFEWNNQNGFTVKKTFSEQSGVLCFHFIDSNKIAFLSNSEQKIKIYNLNSKKFENQFSIPALSEYFCFYNNQFNILANNIVCLYSIDGLLLKTIKIPKKAITFENIKADSSFIYLLTGDQNTIRVNKKTYYIDEIENQYIAGNTFAKILKTDNFSLKLFVFKNNVKIEHNILLNNKLGSAKILGFSNNLILVDIENIVQEIPLKVERKIYLFKTDKDKIIDIKPYISIPNSYYIYMNHDFDISEFGIFHMLTLPEKLSITKILIENINLKNCNPDKIRIYNDNIYDFNYNYNNYLDKGEINKEVFFSEIDKPFLNPITRLQIIGNAIPYTLIEWFADTSNIKNYYCGNKQVTTPQWIEYGFNQGIPYMWGGFSTINEFKTGIKQGKSAGDFITNTGYGAPDCAEGVDCSGFVSRAWGLSSHYATSSIPNISSQYSSYSDLKTGDAVNWAGHHVRLVYKNNMDGSITVIEASGFDWKVSFRNYTYTQLQGNGYLPRKFQNVINDTFLSPKLLKPTIDEENVIINPEFKWTKNYQATFYQIQISSEIDNFKSVYGFTSLDIENNTIPVNKIVTDTFFLWNDSVFPANYNKNYFWTVRAYIPGFGYTLYSMPSSFTTILSNLDTLQCNNCIPVKCPNNITGQLVLSSDNCENYICSTTELKMAEKIYKLKTDNTINLQIKDLSTDTICLMFLKSCDPKSCITQGIDSVLIQNVYPGTYYISVDANGTTNKNYNINIDCSPAIMNPIITNFYINDGAFYTNKRTVYLKYQFINSATNYMISENSDFSGATWKSIITPDISYTLSSGYGNKILYFKLKNSIGESAVVTDSIRYVNDSYISEFENIENRISIYPNPFESILNIDFSQLNKLPEFYYVSDIYGKKIFGKVCSADLNHKILFNNIQKGFYIITFCFGDKKINKSVVKL